ncbi:outer membrane murein-binding lipoprotein Lpp [Pedobacter sp. UYP30]|uniref:hypothetical protein n=1 Tax=Pedobacter sp. UYP30 TaxID=1756400 RepID=UPI0033944310
MKNDKRKNQSKEVKKKTTHLEESLREKLFELVRSLGHDVVDVSEEIIKMSKRLTKKLSKKMKDVLTSSDNPPADSKKVAKAKSKFTAQSKNKNKKIEVLPKAKEKKESKVSEIKDTTSKLAKLEVKPQKMQSSSIAKKTEASSAKTPVTQKSKPKTTPKSKTVKTTGTQNAQSVKSPAKPIRKPNVASRKSPEAPTKPAQQTTAPSTTAKRGAPRNATIGATIKKPAATVKKPTTTAAATHKKMPGRPASLTKRVKNMQSETVEGMVKTDKPAATKKAAVVKPKTTPAQKKPTT